MAFAFASHYHDYEPYPLRPYIGIERGSSDIAGDEAPYVGLNVGSKLSNRTSTELFAQVQVLSDFPGAAFDLSITDTESAFAFMTGVSVTTRLFKDAAFNPFVTAGVGNVAVGHLTEEENGDDYEISELHNYFFSTVGTGLEINIFDCLSIQFQHGYRYIPHKSVLGIAPNDLSGSYNTVAFKVFLE